MVSSWVGNEVVVVRSVVVKEEGVVVVVEGVVVVKMGLFEFLSSSRVVSGAIEDEILLPV